MAENMSEENVRKAMAQIMHPAIDRTLIDLGMVKDIAIEGNKVTVTLAVPFPGIPIKDLLVNSVREPIEKLGAKVEVKLAVMNQQELKAFLAMENESWRG
ncbi:MAG: metal-sulfur cluster biosynthetic enzyme [candidate division Zixibacteria bacterium SM23_73]|nr:MAG: metal-sulfur cluster biosynthetic enzyme [candidate division Zixibacteria bacterium SM23_73]